MASNSFAETLQKLNILYQVLKKHNITLFAAKCTFHQTNIKYVGFEITQNENFSIESNIIKITSFTTPKNKETIKKIFRYKRILQTPDPFLCRVDTSIS